MPAESILLSPRINAKVSPIIWSSVNSLSATRFSEYTSFGSDTYYGKTEIIQRWKILNNEIQFFTFSYEFIFLAPNKRIDILQIINYKLGKYIINDDRTWFCT